jgi:hypothetical protein
MIKNRTLAKIIGYSIVLMAIIAGFSFGFAFPKIYSPSQLDIAQSNLIENLQLYKLMLFGITLVLLLDILVSWTIYLYFKNDNKKLALLSCALRIVYSMIFGIATYFLVKNVGQLNNGNQVVIENYKSFQNIWSIGLIIFGIHLLVVGVLMKLHKLIPKILWYLTIIAGTSYVLVHLLKTTSPQLTELNNLINNILALPMALGEIGLAVWLIIKGGKTK